MFDDKKKRRFNTLQDIKRFVGSLINEAKEKKMDDGEIKQMRSIIYASGVLVDIIKNNELENRLERIEEILKKGV